MSKIGLVGHSLQLSCESVWANTLQFVAVSCGALRSSTLCGFSLPENCCFTQELSDRLQVDCEDCRLGVCQDLHASEQQEEPAAPDQENRG